MSTPIKQVIIFAAALGLACWGSLPASAQTTRGTITGTVTDESGAVVSGVKITVTQIDTGYTYPTTTNGEGNFVATSLSPGRYRVEAEMKGFRKTVIEPLQLHVDERLAVNLVLKVGAVSQEIKVTSQGSLVQTVSSTIGEVVNNQKVEDLPLNGRNFKDLALLAAGTTTVPLGTDNDGQGSVSISGGRSQSNQFSIDGVNDGAIQFNGVNVALSLDAIAEFKVQRNTYSAEFGFGTGQVVVASKTGSNKVHGSAYEFLRNSDLDSRGFFEPAVLPYKQNQFGGSLGGPIIKDKTFFFVNYEGFRSQQLFPLEGATWLSQAQVGGDFSGASPGVVIYNPYTGVPYTNNQIPTTSFSPLTQRLLASGLLPTNLPTNAVTGSESVPFTWDQFTMRVDHRLSSQDSLYGRYTLYKDYSTYYQGIPFTGFAHEGGPFTNGPHNATLQWTHTFSPNLLNELKFGYNRMYQSYSQDGANGKNLLQFQGESQNPATFGLPVISIAGFTSFDTAIAAPLTNGENNYEYRDDLTWVHGSHTLKMGGSFRDIQYPIAGTLFARGDFEFQGAPYPTTPANLVPEATALQSAADFLVGAPFVSIGDGAYGLAYMTWHAFSGFIQDDWKVAPRLTLNLGLRYDRMGVALDRWVGRVGIFDPIIGQVVRGKAVDSDGLVNPDNKGIQPRFGFSWQPFDKSNTVIRGGFGLYRDLRPFNERSFTLGTNFAYQVDVNILPLLGIPSPTSASWDNLFPAGPSSSPGILTDDPFARDPYSEMWSFGVQRALPYDSVLEVMYVGQAGHFLDTRLDINQASLPPLVNGVPDLSSPIGPRRPYPNLGNILMTKDIANSNYNALQVRWEKRFSHNLSFLASYAYSKSLDSASSTCDASNCNSGQDNRDLRAEYGPSAFDQRQHLVVSPIFLLPFGKGQRYLTKLSGAADKLVNGWQVSTIANFASGQPFSLVTAGVDRTDTGTFGGGIQYATCTANPRLSSGQRTVQRDFNTSNVLVTPLGTYGDCGRDTLTARGYNNWDISLIKNTSVAERVTLQFRAEFFNAFNRAQFSPPAADPTNAATFGVISSVSGIPREIQFALKLLF